MGSQRVRQDWVTFTFTYLALCYELVNQTNWPICYSSSTSLALGFTGGSEVKRLPAMQETWLRSLGWEDPWRKKWQPTPVFLPGESHGERSLVGYSPWGRKEVDTTEWLTLTFSFIIRTDAEKEFNKMLFLCFFHSKAKQNNHQQIGYRKSISQHDKEHVGQNQS